MKHGTVARYWRDYAKLPKEIRDLADKDFNLLKADPHHPSLQLKRVGEFWSVRIGSAYRALGVDDTIESCGSGLGYMMSTNGRSHGVESREDGSTVRWRKKFDLL